MKARVFVLVAMFAYALPGQVLIPGLQPGQTSRLLPSDAAVLEVREPLASLPCTVQPVRPDLGFDLAFHAGYRVRLRLRDLAGSSGLLTTVFRVTPQNHPESPIYFGQKWRVPVLDPDTEGETSLEGSFTVGEGDYQVDWLMRDHDERICSAYWKIAAHLPIRNAALPGARAPGKAAPNQLSIDKGKNSAGSAPPLKVELLFNVAPRTQDSVTIPSSEREVLVSMLRGISSDTRLGVFSITAFNLSQKQVVFQQENVTQIDFERLDHAIESASFGTVSVSQLADHDSEARFLTQLAGERAKVTGTNLVIFVGMKAAEDASIARDLLQQLGNATCPVFYLTYSTTADFNPFPDLIGSAVKYWRGKEFVISRPLDLLSAWAKIISQLGRGNSGNS